MQPKTIGVGLVGVVALPICVAAVVGLARLSTVPLALSLAALTILGVLAVGAMLAPEGKGDRP